MSSQQGYREGDEPMWWWKVALHLDEAQLALANAMAHNVDDPRPVQALYTRLREGQAILLEIMRAKGLLPGEPAPPVHAMPPMPPMPTPSMPVPPVPAPPQVPVASIPVPVPMHEPVPPYVPDIAPPVPAAVVLPFPAPTSTFLPAVAIEPDAPAAADPDPDEAEDPPSGANPAETDEKPASDASAEGTAG